MSHTSVERYKGTLQPLPEIARELGVDAVVEGTVTRSGDRVRITAQLIDARSDTHLWAETYQRDMRDVLALQDELARDIAEEVRINLTPAEQSRTAMAGPLNPEAYGHPGVTISSYREMPARSRGRSTIFSRPCGRTHRSRLRIRGLPTATGWDGDRR